MKSFLVALVVSVVVAVGASFTLAQKQEPVSEAFSTNAVRLSDPGTNLIGVN